MIAKDYSDLRAKINGSPTLTSMFADSCNTMRKNHPTWPQDQIEAEVLRVWDKIEKTSMTSRKAKRGQILCVPPAIFEQIMNGTYDNNKYKLIRL